MDGLYESFAFRTIRPEEAETAAEIEATCFPPNEACSREMMLQRVELAADLFLVAVDRGGRWPVSFAAMIVGALLVSWVLWL